jgi:glycosyltransferase involved in cell wall biosynthesis
MRIGVLRTQVPFVNGGAERHAASLCAALNQYGHEAVEITLPFKWYPGKTLASNILAAKMLDLSEVEGVPVDMVIGLKFPAYLIPHPNKLFWIIHQHRQAYDQWKLGNSDLLHDDQGGALRQLIHEEDRLAFTQSPHPIYANSKNVAQRMQEFLGIASTALYHPPPLADLMRMGSYGDYLFAPGRINPSKRLELILRALAETRSKMRLVIAGVSENPAYQEKLYKMSLELGISSQVEWLGPVDDDTLLEKYAGAKAVVFVPQDEDYGYITLEAMLSAKPVITVSDAGGPLEFITHKENGLIADPTPRSLALAFNEVMEGGTDAEQMGLKGHTRYHALNIHWEHIVRTLTGHANSLPEESKLPLTASSATAEEAKEPEQRDPQDAAVEKLQAAIAPPPPPTGYPFKSITDVLSAYAFEELPKQIGKPETPVDPGLAGYLGTHWTRFETTLNMLQSTTPKRALDVGVFPPLVFQAMLANKFPDIEMCGLWEGPNPYRQHIESRSPSYPNFDIRLEPANSERDRWPYDDESFDLVTGMEILEHLALDPHFFFSEASRVLQPNGYLLLTTPNVVSHRGVWKMLNGIAPYSFGIFVPSGGVYGRHNREYAPPELVRLGEAAGFEMERLNTFDVYDRNVDPATAEMLESRGDDLTLRGETIFYLARKVGKPTTPPENFYHGNPVLMSAEFSHYDTEEKTGLTHLGLKNKSSAWWPIKGDRATCLLAEWIDPNGDLRHQHLFQPFTSPIGPNEMRDFSIRLLPADQNTASGLLRLHAFQQGVGVFTGSGRAAPITLPCTESAFLHLVRSVPTTSA